MTKWRTGSKLFSDKSINRFSWSIFLAGAATSTAMAPLSRSSQIVCLTCTTTTEVPNATCMACFKGRKEGKLLWVTRQRRKYLVETCRVCFEQISFVWCKRKSHLFSTLRFKGNTHTHYLWTKMYTVMWWPTGGVLPYLHAWWCGR